MTLGAVACAPPGRAEDYVCDVAFAHHGALQLPLADTPDKQVRGLARQSVQRGLLFAWPITVPVAFWMEETPMALTAYFIADDGTLYHSARMEPYSKTVHRAARGARYAIELADELADLTLGDRITAITCRASSHAPAR